MDKKAEIIEELVGDLKEFKPAVPSVRVAIFWTIISLVATILLSLATQPFRANFIEQAFSSPRYFIELASGFLIVFFCAWYIFSLSIPGEKVVRTKAALIFSAVVFSGLIAYSFIEPSTTASMVGKRPYCFYEGLLYGSILSLSLLAIARRRAVFFRSKVGLLSGVAGVGITAIVMHAACMYDPLHVLDHHILPVLFVSVFGLIGAKFLLPKL